jgi:fatty-acyl-CoA synthase
LRTEPTPTRHSLPFRAANFPTLTAALDYAAHGETGTNFYNSRGDLYSSLTFTRVRDEAMRLARRFIGMGLVKGDRVAMVAETHPDFLRVFFGCQYAGLIPVALPATINLGGHQSYVAQLRGLIDNSGARIAIASEGFLPFVVEAVEGLNIDMVGEPAEFDALPESEHPLPTIDATDVAYLQYTSGSTRFPRGVIIQHRSVMNNLAGIITDGVKIHPGDRCFSWLPFYHDMGLVGLVLVPVAAQMSVDYMDTRDFAMRPRQWLSLLSKTKATISFSPSFGYELCARRLRDGEAARYDLSNWRVAGIGAEMIRWETLDRFAAALAPSGFNSSAFLACYGMAECSLAISFAPLYQGYQTDRIDLDQLADNGEARPVAENDSSKRSRAFVMCGKPLPEYALEIRNERGVPVSERASGTIFVRGPSVMSGYFNAPADTDRTLDHDGWLNTGDIGYMLDGNLVITGRQKDLIIINGRNIWPQDLEYLAEHQAETRVGDALAFSVPGPESREICVLVVQCRETNLHRRTGLVDRLTRLVRLEMGIDCYVELVPPHALPRTSSGKLSRSTARQEFMATHDLAQIAALAEGTLLRKASA